MTSALATGRYEATFTPPLMPHVHDYVDNSPHGHFQLYTLPRQNQSQD